MTRFVEARSSFGIMLMTEEHYIAVYEKEFFITDGYIDMKRAFKSGVRIFVFVNNEAVRDETSELPGWLDRNPDARPFVTGTWDDLERIRRGGKIRIRDIGYQGIMNPLQNCWNFDVEERHELRLCETTPDAFLMYFGKRERTIRFARPPEGEGDLQMTEIF